MADLLSFFGDIGKKLHGIEAQLNPFDGGQNYNTVVNNAPVQQPKPVAQPQASRPIAIRQNNGFNGGQSQPVINLPKPTIITTPIIQPPKIQAPPAFTPQQQAALQFAPKMLNAQGQQQWLAQHQDKVQQPIKADYGKAIGQVVNNVNNAVVKPIVGDVNKAVNTVAAPVAGITGSVMAGADQLFNGGRNAQNILNATQAQMNSNINNSFVPQRIAQGKASPAEFAGSIAKTGIHLAPYFIAPGAGGITEKLGQTVGAKVGTTVAGKLAGKGAEIGANSAIAAPTFAALNALQQGADSGFQSFDPGQANMAGLQAAAMTAAGGLVHEAARPTVNVAAKGIQKTAAAIHDATPQVIANARKALTDERGSINLGAIQDSVTGVNRHPAMVQLQDHMQTLRQLDERMAEQGLSPNSAPRINNHKAQQATVAEINRTRRIITQGGYAKIPFNKDQSALPFNDTPKNESSPKSSPDKNLSSNKATSLTGENKQTLQSSQLDSSKGSIAVPTPPSLKTKILASKPVDFFYGDKQPVIDAKTIRDTGRVSPKSTAIPAPEMPVNKRGLRQEQSAQMARVSKKQSQTVSMSQAGDPSHLSSTHIGKETPSAQRSNLQKSSAPSHFDGSSLSYDNTTPNMSKGQFNAKEYVKQQTKAQETARKQGNDNKLTQLKKDLNVKLIDSLSPIEKTFKKATHSGKDVPLTRNITPQLDRAIRADTIAGQYIRDNGLAKVIQKVKNTKEFDQYLIAKHAADLAKNGVETGRNLAADKQLVESLKGKYEPHAQVLTKYSQGLLDKSVNYGLVSRETAALLKKKYPNYVPANRIFGDGELNVYKGTGGGKASISGQSVVKKIKGSTREIESPLASLAHKTTQVISEGERNKAASMLASYHNLPDNPFNLRRMKPTETVGTKSTISYLDNGKLVRYETTPEIAAAAKSLNKEQIGILGKIVRVPTRALRLGATGINAGFALANVAKDLVSAAINSKHMFRSSVFNPKVLGKATSAALYHRGKSYGELVREGAGGTSFDIARDAPRQTIKAIRAEKNVGTKILYNVSHPAALLRAVEDTIGRSEEFTRGLQYYGNKEAALKKGMSTADATIYGAHAARNNSVNFARAGEYGAVLNSALPYLNAGIQGARTFVRNVKERPVQTVAKVAVLSTLPAVTTTAWNLSDDKRKAAYNDISDYEKQNNIIIVPPNPVKDQKTGRWNVIKIPVSQEIANLNNIARNAVEAAVGNKSFDAKELVGDLVGTTTSINAGSTRQVANQITPQAIKPVIEGITNQNLFTGNQIVPDSQKNLPNADQYGQYTSGTAKVLGGITNQSPRKIDNFVKTMFGGAGQNAVNVSDTLLSKAGVVAPSSIQGKTIIDAMGDRFNSAASKPISDTVSQTYEKAKQQLINTPQYKALAQDEKAKSLNRLQTDISAIEYNKSDTANPNPAYPPKKLTANQQALVNGTKSIASYTVAPTGNSVSIAPSLDKQSASTLAQYNAMSADDRTKTFRSTPAAEYQYDLAKYNNDKASGSISSIQDITKQKDLAKEKVGSVYPKDVRDLYSMSKADIATYLNTPEDNVNKQLMAKQLIAYDQALNNAGLTSYLKFKTGIAPSKGGGKKGSSKKGGIAPSASLESLIKAAAAIKPPTPPAAKKPTATSYKRATLAKYTPKKAAISGGNKITVRRGIA